MSPLWAQPAAADKVTVALAVTKNNNTLAGNQVQITVTAASSKGVITNLIWNCENGSAATGAPPAGWPPLSVPMSGTLPASILCVYRNPGTYRPNVFAYDSLGKQNWTNAAVTVKAPGAAMVAEKVSLAKGN